MIEILEKDSEEIKIKVKGINPALAAMIRRAIISEIPTLAIETVKIIKNDSVLRDEILANRLGLIPLKFNKEKLKKLKNNVESYKVKLFIKKKGGGYVYTKDMISEDSEVIPLYENIPITYLTDIDELEIECETQIGYGKWHAKWQAGNCGYEYENDEFIFNIETTSYYKPEELFFEALEVIEEKLVALSKSI